MKKVLSIAFILTLALPLVSSATVVDVCGQEFTYNDNSIGAGTHTQISDSRLFVETINTGNLGNPDSITITAGSGYQVIFYGIEVEDFNAPGDWDVQGSGNVTNLNPVGTEIESIQVIVKKLCVDVCTDPEATNYDSEVGEFEVSNNAICEYPEPPVVDVCDNLDGDQATVPEGYVQNGENCDLVSPPPTDLCPEEGVQTVLPCAVVEPPPAPPAPPSPIVETSHRSGDAPRWCSPTRLEFCKWPDGTFGDGTLKGFNSSGNLSWLEQQILNLMQQLIQKLKLEIELVSLSL